MWGGGFWLGDIAPGGMGGSCTAPGLPGLRGPVRGPSGEQAHGQDSRAQRKTAVNVEAQVRGAGSGEWGGRALLPAQQCMWLGKCKSEVWGPGGPWFLAEQSRAVRVRLCRSRRLGEQSVGSHFLRATGAMTHLQCQKLTRDLLSPEASGSP